MLDPNADLEACKIEVITIGGVLIIPRAEGQTPADLTEEVGYF